MKRLRCATCGAEHDLTQLEPSFTRPGAFDAVPVQEREHRTLSTDEWCVVRDADDSERRYFLRVVVPLAVHGEARGTHWGVWAEVSQEAYARVTQLWEDPEQSAEPPIPARMANELPGYPPTIGLPGTLQLVAPTKRPVFRLDLDVEHPFAAECRDGVTPERVLQWLDRELHP